MKLQMMFLLLTLGVISSSARAQSKSGKICVWADSEDPGIVMPTQPGGSVNSISGSEASFIQQMIVAGLKADKTNNVVDPCPRTGENIEIDVVIGQFLGGYVASASIEIEGGKAGPIHVSSNVVAAKTDKLLASYEKRTTQTADLTSVVARLDTLERQSRMFKRSRAVVLLVLICVVLMGQMRVKTDGIRPLISTAKSITQS